MVREAISSLTGLVGIMALCATSTPLADDGNTSGSDRSSIVEDILSLETLATPDPIAVSPDGKWLAVTVQSHRRRRHGGGEGEWSRYLPTGFPTGLEGSEIWIVEVESKEYQNLTPDWGTSWRPSWSPDGRQLAFYSDRNGIARLWIWERDTTQPLPACDAIIRPFVQRDVPPRWTPDGTRIIVKLKSETTPEQKGSGTNASRDEATVRIFRSISKAPDQTEATLVPRSPYRSLADIGVVTVATGEVRRLAREFRPSGLIVSPDGTAAAVMDFWGHESVRARQSLYDLHLLPLDGNPPRCLAERIRYRGGLGDPFSWSPDGRYIAYVTAGPTAKGDLFIVSTVDGSQRNLTSPTSRITCLVTGQAIEHTSVKLGNERSEPPLWSSDSQHLFCVAGSHLWQVSVEDGSVLKLTGGLGRSVVRSVHRSGEYTLWSPDDGKSVYVQTFHSQTKQTGFYRIDIRTGERARLVEEDRLYHSSILHPDVAPDTGDIFYILEDRTHPADVWRADASFQNRKQLTRLNPRVENRSFGEARLVDWKTSQGEELRGVLLLPADYIEGQRYPLITKIYGGSFLSNMLNYFGLAVSPVDNMYLLTSQGYAVFLPDIPMRTNNPIQELSDAVLSGVDMVINLGIADVDRLGVIGHSYGGYCVNAIITQTQRFRAAVSSASIANLVSFYGFLTEDGISVWISWAEMSQGAMGGSLWEYRGRYIENSPIFHLDRVETPLLLIHGELDATSASAQAGEMFSGLRRLGKEAVLARYLNEEHWPGTWRYPNAVDFWRRVLAWFDDHLKS
jgi:dipeptidyl aminopeptidase/acylaminoacyl peptidase